MKKAIRVKSGGGLTSVYDLRKSGMTKAEANQLANAIRSSGKKARVVKQSRGNYAVYSK